MLKRILLTSLLLIITACSNPKGTYNKELFEIITNSRDEFTSAYIKDNLIYVRSKTRNQPIFFTGDVEKIVNNQLIDYDLFLNRRVMLNFSNVVNYDSNRRGSYDEIKYLTLSEWLPVIQDTFEHMVPKNNDAGILIPIQDEETVFYRNKKGEIQNSLINKKPDFVNIEKYYTYKEYNDILYKKIAEKFGNSYIERYKADKTNKKEPSNKGRFLLFESPEREDGWLFILVDLQTKLSYPLIVEKGRKINRAASYTMFTGKFLGSFVLKSHIIEIIKNPVSSSYKLVTSGTTHISRAITPNIKKSADKPLIPINSYIAPMDLVEFDKELNKKGHGKSYKGTMEFLIRGDEFFPDLIKEIEGAKESIHIRLYIFDNDDYAARIADLLRKKSNEGIDVKILIDSLATVFEEVKESKIPPKNGEVGPRMIKAYLKKDSNIKVRTRANTWLVFDHVKTISIDGKTVYLGGMNIGKEYRYSWHDMMIKMKGPISEVINEQFNRAWALSSWKGDAQYLASKVGNNPDIKKITAEAMKDNGEKYADIRLQYTKYFTRDIYRAKLLAIKRAKQYIYIENPYLTDYKIVNELIKARERGVDVRIILPTHNNVYYMKKSNILVTNRLLENGVRVYFYPGMTHIKASIYDGYVMLGTANFDKLSLIVNEEMNIAFYNLEYAREVKQRLFEKDLSISKELTQPLPFSLLNKGENEIEKFL